MKVLVSLTSISGRIDRTHLVLESLMRQTIQPDEIHLYLSHEPYLLDEGIPNVPEAIKRLLSRRMLVHWVPNTGPYRKFMPVLKENWGNDVLIVVVDDDVIHDKRMIERLLWRYVEHSCVITTNARWSIYNEDGTMLPYDQCPMVRRVEVKRMDIVPLHNAGVLYHPKFFTERVFSEEARELVPTNEDLWLHLNTCLTNTPVYALGRVVDVFDRVNCLYAKFNQAHNDAMFAKAAAALGVSTTDPETSKKV